MYLWISKGYINGGGAMWARGKKNSKIPVGSNI